MTILLSFYVSADPGTTISLDCFIGTILDGGLSNTRLFLFTYSSNSVVVSLKDNGCRLSKDGFGLRRDGVSKGRIKGSEEGWERRVPIW